MEVSSGFYLYTTPLHIELSSGFYLYTRPLQIDSHLKKMSRDLVSHFVFFYYTRLLHIVDSSSFYLYTIPLHIVDSLYIYSYASNYKSLSLFFMKL